MKAYDGYEPFVPKLMLFHNPKKCRSWCMKNFGECPEFVDSDAQTFRIGNTSVVLVTYSGDGGVSEDALMVHEAYHIVCQSMEAMGESSPGEEIVAYMLQLVAAFLIDAQHEWREKHGGKGD